MQPARYGTEEESPGYVNPSVELMSLSSKALGAVSVASAASSEESENQVPAPERLQAQGAASKVYDDALLGIVKRSDSATFGRKNSNGSGKTAREELASMISLFRISPSSIDLTLRMNFHLTTKSGAR